MGSRYNEMLHSLSQGTLSPEAFSHRDHVATAWLALKKHEFFEASLIFARGLQMLTKSAGVPEKYNATVTLAFMSLIGERMAHFPAETADEFIDANPDFLEQGAIARLYSKDRLASDVARKVGLLPDARA